MGVELAVNGERGGGEISYVDNVEDLACLFRLGSTVARDVDIALRDEGITRRRMVWSDGELQFLSASSIEPRLVVSTLGTSGKAYLFTGL